MTGTITADVAFSRSRKILRGLSIVSLVLSSVSMLLVLYGVYAIPNITSWISQAVYPMSDVAHRQAWVTESGVNGYIFGFGVFLMLGTHFLNLGVIVQALRTLVAVRTVATVALGLCAISTVLNFSDWACLHDIAVQFPRGMAYDMEWRWLQLGFVVHGIFFVCQFVMLSKTLSSLRENGVGRSTLMGENLFVAMHVLGAVCAAIGLGLSWVLYTHHLPVKAWKWSIVPMFCMVTLPYFLVFAVWVWRAYKDREAGLFDEKQKYDLMRAGVTAWLVSIVAMGFFFLVHIGNPSGPGSVLWLPFFLYVTLLTFSVSGLFYFRST